MEVESLPLGKGVIDVYVPYKQETEGQNTNFALYDVESIEISDSTDRAEKVVYIGDDEYIYPILKGKYGNQLNGPYEAFTDDICLGKGSFPIKVNDLIGKEFKQQSVEIYLKSGNALEKVTIRYEIHDENSINKIERSFKSGIIDEDTKYNFFAYSLIDENKLPVEYRSEDITKCSTSTILDIQNYIIKCREKGLEMEWFSEFEENFKTPVLAPSIIIDGSQITSDVLPIIENGRVLVPYRAIAEAIGATVTWDGQQKIVTAIKDDIVVKLKIDDKNARKTEKLLYLMFCQELYRIGQWFRYVL